MSAREKSIHEVHGYFQRYIGKLAAVPFSVEPRVQSLELSRGAVQMAYKEMRKIQFAGNIVDYLIWVGGMFLMDVWSESIEDKPDDVDVIELINNMVSSRISYGIILIRASNIFRVTDLFSMSTKSGNWSNLANSIRVLSILRGLLVSAQSDGSTQSKVVKKLESLGFGETTKRILEYQSVKGKIHSSSSHQQPTKQPNKKTNNQIIHEILLEDPSGDITVTHSYLESDINQPAERSEARPIGRRAHRPSKPIRPA